MPNEKDRQTGKQKPKWHHFDIGNSTAGPMGMAGELIATSRDEAARRLIDLLPEEIDLGADLTGLMNQGEYVRLYINPQKIVRAMFNDTRPLEEVKRE